MKQITRYFFTIYIILLLAPIKLLSQTNQPSTFSYFNLSKHQVPSLCDEDRAIIKNEIRESIQSLQSRGLLRKSIQLKADSAYFAWPLRAANGLTDPEFYSISGFVDHDSDAPDHLLDYNGGTRTYDLESGYNHRGTDFATWPFGWYKMDYDQVEVVSMAPGTIVGKVDGNFDRNCAMNDSSWNAVYVLHDNGAVAWYGHMKKNSLTDKGIGDSVETGEYLGVVGSSGSSTGPHLHLEIYDENENLIDPWAGPYNPTIESSWWMNQPPYYDSKLMRVESHSTWPEFPDCPQQEIYHTKNEFTYGDTVYLVSFYRDMLREQISNHKITTADNLTYWAWDFHIPDEEGYLDYYSASWWGWWSVIPQSASLGTWQYSIFYENTLYTHYFTVTDNASAIDETDRLPVEFYLSNSYPNPFNPTTKIDYYIPQTDEKSPLHVRITVHDILGNLLKTLVNENKNPGYYETEFDGENLSSGTYFYTLSAGNFRVTRKMILLK